MYNKKNILTAATLCSRIAGEGAISPKQWLQVCCLLDRAGHAQPSALLEMTSQQIESVGIERRLAEKIHFLLGTAEKVGERLGFFEKQGISFLQMTDEAYPETLIRRLQSDSPPLLYYIGNAALLSRDGISLTGSRDLDSESARFAEEVGRQAAALGYTLISGGARGADTIAADAAVKGGGSIVLYLSCDLLKVATRPEMKKLLSAGRAVLCMAQNPTAPFTSYGALSRNQYIYLSSVASFVAASKAGRGGSYNGAAQNVKRGMVPTFVYMRSDGNRELASLGAHPLEDMPDIAALI